MQALSDEEFTLADILSPFSSSLLLFSLSLTSLAFSLSNFSPRQFFSRSCRFSRFLVNFLTSRIFLPSGRFSRVLVEFLPSRQFSRLLVNFLAFPSIFSPSRQFSRLLVNFLAFPSTFPSMFLLSRQCSRFLVEIFDLSLIFSLPCSLFLPFSFLAYSHFPFFSCFFSYSLPLTNVYRL
jgi:hypothetical protein